MEKELVLEECAEVASVGLDAFTILFEDFCFSKPFGIDFEIVVTQLGALDRGIIALLMPFASLRHVLLHHCRLQKNVCTFG